MKHVIVVDDDRAVREIVTFTLERQGFAVHAASSGQQLKQQLAACAPDLIILDVMMPGEDGYHIITTLRHDPETQHIPVIMMTAHDEDIYGRLSADLGAAEHITKPFHPLALIECVHTLLRDNEQN